MSDKPFFIFLFKKYWESQNLNAFQKFLSADFIYAPQEGFNMDKKEFIQKLQTHFSKVKLAKKGNKYSLEFEIKKCEYCIDNETDSGEAVLFIKEVIGKVKGIKHYTFRMDSEEIKEIRECAYFSLADNDIKPLG